MLRRTQELVEEVRQTAELLHRQASETRRLTAEARHRFENQGANGSAHIRGRR